MYFPLQNAVGKCDEEENPATFSTCMRGVTASVPGRCLRPEGTRPYIQQIPRTWQMTQVGKRKIELSNLEKVLCPEDGVLKVPCRGRNVRRPTEGTDVSDEPELDLTDRSDETRVVPQRVDDLCLTRHQLQLNGYPQGT